MGDAARAPRPPQREFVADASHQLRTPLTGLRLRLEEARATGDPEEIDAALAEVDRLSAMVSELLLLSQAGEVDAPAEEIDLGAAPPRGRRRASTAASPPSPARRAAGPRCAPADLERTLDALIENALNYGGRRGHRSSPAPAPSTSSTRARHRPRQELERCSSASTAAAPAAPGRPAPASASRSPAS